MRRPDVVIVGAGLGGVAASLAASRLGATVLLTEPTDWPGGQLTVQGVPLDEHPWIETHGCTESYARFRRTVRAFYRQHYPLTARARDDAYLNPGLGNVGRLCHEPRVAVTVLGAMLAPFRASSRLTVRYECDAIGLETTGDRVESIRLLDKRTGHEFSAAGAYYLDATELGDLLPLGHVEHVIGSESQADTGEPHALPTANPADQIAIAFGFALEYRPGEDHVIARPAEYDFWRGYQAAFRPSPQLDWHDRDPISGEEFDHRLFEEPGASGRQPLWLFRRLLCRDLFEPGFLDSDVSMVYWPQSDYWIRPIIDLDSRTSRDAVDGAKGLSRSLLYWLQTEAPRPDGKTGYPGLRLRPDVTGTPDGFVKHPYAREGRRIVGEFRVVEQHVGVDARRGIEGAERFDDSVGIGSHRLDLHPSTGPREYIDLAHWPFQIPLGALLPIRVENLLAACKNIGTTHVTNSAYRFHPVEWNVGEAAGALAAFCVQRGTRPRQVRQNRRVLAEFQSLLADHLGVPLAWPAYRPYGRHDHGPWPLRYPVSTVNRPAKRDT
jgi:glycine/D-amino acid oxidase-like deaminating enzyme